MFNYEIGSNLLYAMNFSMLTAQKKSGRSANVLRDSTTNLDIVVVERLIYT